MQLVSIELNHYKPMSTTGFTHFKLTPQELVQVILGTNGSGKSSLIREIIPAPAERARFRAGGYKAAKYLHNNRTYRLIYDYDSNRHSLLEEFEGVVKELNEGGTGKVQDEVIRELFGVTPFIRSLMTGELRFSEMNPQKRRELFTMMSPVPFDYVMQFYGRAKEKLNETSAYLRRLKKQLVDEVGKIMGQEQYQLLQAQSQTLHAHLELLFAERAPIERSASELAQDKAIALERLREASERILRTNLGAPTQVTINSLEALESLIVSERESLAALQTQRSERSSQFEALREQVSIVKRTDGTSVEDLELRISAQEQARQALVTQLSDAGLAQNYQSLLPGFSQAAYEQLVTIFQEQPNNEALHYSNAKLQALDERLAKTQEYLKAVSINYSKLEGIIHELDRHKATEAVNCPACQHAFIVGYDPHQYEQRVKELAQTKEELARNEAILDELKAQRADYTQFFDRYKHYLQIRSQYRQFEALWVKLDHEHLAFKYPMSALQLIERWVRDLELLGQIKRIDEQLNQTQVLLGLARQVDQAKLTEDQLKLTKLEQEITEVTWRITQQQQWVKTLTEYAQRLKELTGPLAQQLNALQAQANQLHTEQIATLRQETIHGLIRSTQTKLAQNEDLLTQADAQIGLVEHLQHQVTQLEIEELAWKRTVEEVSPSAGLIAESMMGYINGVIEQANEIIAKVWTYSFRILPCEFKDDGEVGLTYRFPIDIADGVNEIKDIIEGSKAQKEITDLAIRIVALVYLGFDTSMLMLDEFGDGFDPKHKACAVHAVNAIIEQMNFSQVFMVSHSESSFGALKNNDVCLLSDANIQVTGVVNQHVQMH